MGCVRVAALPISVWTSVFIGNFGSSIYFRIASQAYDLLYCSSMAGFRHNDFRILARRLRAKSSRTHDLTADRPIACGVRRKDIDHLGYVAYEQAFGDRTCRKCLVFGNYLVESRYHFEAYWAPSSSWRHSLMLVCKQERAGDPAKR
jgi:hypothetical protein